MRECNPSPPLSSEYRTGLHLAGEKKYPLLPSGKTFGVPEAASKEFRPINPFHHQGEFSRNLPRILLENPNPKQTPPFPASIPKDPFRKKRRVTTETLRTRRATEEGPLTCLVFSEKGPSTPFRLRCHSADDDSVKSYLAPTNGY